MALFLFLLFVSVVCVFFKVAILLLSFAFAADLTSRAAPSCSGSSDASDSEKSVKRGATLDSPLYL